MLWCLSPISCLLVFFFPGAFDDPPFLLPPRHAQVMAYCMPLASLILVGALFIPYKSLARTCRLYGPEFCPQLSPASRGESDGGDEGLAAPYLVVSPPLAVARPHGHHYPSPGEFGLGDRCSEAMLLLNAAVSPRRAWQIAGLLSTCTFTAFVLSLNEFVLIGRTSALGLGVAGVVKTVLMFVATTSAFHESAGLVQAAGLSIALSGVCYYYYLRYRDPPAEVLA